MSSSCIEDLSIQDNHWYRIVMRGAIIEVQKARYYALSFFSDSGKELQKRVAHLPPCAYPQKFLGTETVLRV